MESLTKARKIGRSIMLAIPKEIIESESIQEGEIVKIKVEKIKKSGFGMLKRMRSFTKEDKFDTKL